MLPRPILDRLVKPLGRLDDRDKRALQVDPLVSIAEHDDWVCFDESVDERCVPARSFPNRFRERELAHVHSAGGLLRGDDRAASVKPHDGAMGSQQRRWTSAPGEHGRHRQTPCCLAADRVPGPVEPR